MSYCLLAIAGDCSAGGNTEAADYIVISRHFEIIKLYLRNQLAMEIQAVVESDSTQLSPEYIRLWEEHHALGNALIDLGVFHHKWHKRTTWALWELDNDKPINVTGPLIRYECGGGE